MPRDDLLPDAIAAVALGHVALEFVTREETWPTFLAWVAGETGEAGGVTREQAEYLAGVLDDAARAGRGQPL